MSVELVDNSMYVKAEINDAAIAFLHEAGGELEAQVKRNSRVGKTGDTKGKWQYAVDEPKGECIVGNPLENAIWEEFGTGEYAVNGDGRKGGWTYKDESDNTWHHTYGKTPNRALERAFASLKSALIRRAEEVLKGRLE